MDTYPNQPVISARNGCDNPAETAPEDYPLPKTGLPFPLGFIASFVGIRRTC